jgi:AcrR family transcriptional regulator
MNISRQPEGGRANQKARTRSALVEAAASLLRQQVTPTVEEAAEAARISRATAYRYFPTQESLLLEIATVAPMMDPVEKRIQGLDQVGASEGLSSLIEAMGRTTFENEAQMRTALRLYMDQWIEARRRGDPSPSMREGRRMRYLDTVLTELRKRLPQARWRRLRAALALVMGAESLVVMKDVCKLEEDEALEVLRWAGLALLRAGLSEAKNSKRKVRRS